MIWVSLSSRGACARQTLPNPFRNAATAVLIALLLTCCSRSSRRENANHDDNHKKVTLIDGSVATEAPPAPTPAASASNTLETTETPACLQTANGQAQLNICASDTARRAELSMERLVDSILKKHESDAAFIRKFKAAQKAWELYRDAELAARFPAEDPQVEYGSVFPMCWDLEHARLSRERIRLLQPWSVSDPAEGEVCRGSY